MLNCCYCYDDLAVQVLLASREHLNLGKVKNNNYNESAASGNSEVKMQDIDPIQACLIGLIEEMKNCSLLST
ncbi:hypothetical protein AQUCO_02700080v1 [Aquilegia coerulea]|uniref:Uncharacterized protein n=1 Tax=Aquilegia coerulea TaxID=218851 RepID=A0A2G5D517_AQUCA|nr:hypothetical protein AQUCO_02700080v1 [Aquilegia coerulea]